MTSILRLAAPVLTFACATNFATLSAANDADRAKDLILATGITVTNWDGPDHFDQLGRIADSDVFFGRGCNASYSGTLVMVHARAGQEPEVWSYDETCVRQVAWRDIDGDGKPEIRLTTSGGGTGTLTTSEDFYRWPASDRQPTLITSFISHHYESWGGAYGKYGFEPQEFYPIQLRQNNFLPVGSLCPSNEECALVIRKTFCIESCEMQVPAGMEQDPGWPAFVKAITEDGYQIGNLQPAKEVPVAEKEMQAAFDAWVSE